MQLLHLCDEVAMSALCPPCGGPCVIGHTHPLQLAANCYCKLHRCFRAIFKSCNSATPTAMGQSKSLSLDPEEPIQFMNNFDCDFSDDFEWYIDEDEWLEETMSRQIKKIEVETVL